MGTRGLMGLVIDGEVKATYNHFDSYPSGLGADVIRDLTEKDIDTMREQARNITLVDEDGKPTPEQIELLMQHANLSVGDQSLESWYSLLRNLQGQLAKTLETGYMIEYADFALDSLFCEWGYLANFDTDTLEVYRGFQKDPSEVVGRFAGKTDPEDVKWREERGMAIYAPITLVAEIPFSDLKDFDMNAFEEKMYADD